MKKYCEFLNEEIEFNLIPVNFTIEDFYFDNRKIDKYTFLSKSNNPYSVYFMLTEEDDEVLPNKKHLSDYIDIKNIPTIYFSSEERKFDDTFDELTDRKEYLDVMGKVAYIILQYINTHEYDVYSYNADKKRNNFYGYYWKYFNDYLLVELPSKNYLDDGNKKITNFLIKDYQRYITESNFIKFSNGAILKMPWVK